MATCRTRTSEQMSELCYMTWLPVMRELAVACLTWSCFCMAAAWHVTACNHCRRYLSDDHCILT